jgi:hydrophobic/amphiphilic exporter-1 (mainly G- bacteria), HAE1 family
MSLPRLAVKRPVTTGMIVVSAIVLGGMSMGLINLDMFPSFDRPVLQVTVPYPDAAPTEVERRIVRPLEEGLGTVRSLESIRSSASQNRGQVTLEFRAGTNMDVAALEVRERIGVVRRELPQDVQEVQLRRYSSDEQPLLRGSIGWEGDPGLLSDIVVRQIEPALLQVDGVAAVQFSGLQSREVAIELDQDRLRSSGVTLAQINLALSRGNQDYSAGEIELDGTRFLVRAEGQLQTVEEIERLPLNTAGVRIGDVAEVRYDFPERTSFHRIDGVEARQLEVFRESDANIVEVARNVREALAEVGSRPGLEGLSFQVWQDQSEGILEVLSLLASAGMFGGILAVVVLFLFLKRITPTLIVAAAIPVSLIFTVAILYVAGESLNIVSLSGLMLAVGMLIDNAVVVVENIFRHREMGSDAVTAAEEGAGEVGLAVLSGTLTTVIVFTPLFFFPPNEMGSYFRAFGTSISFTMLASLGIAFTLVPLLAARILKGHMPGPGRVVQLLNRGYRATLSRALQHRMATAALTVVLFGTGGWMLWGLPRDLMPLPDQRFVRLAITTPRDLSFEERSDILGIAEGILLNNRERFEIETISTSSPGSSSSINVSLRSFSDGASLSTAEISEMITAELPEISGVQWTSRRGFGAEAPAQVRLLGDNSMELASVADLLAAYLEANVPGLQQVQSSLVSGDEEVRVRVDRMAAEREGLTSRQIAEAISGGLRGSVSTRFRSGEREVDVLVQLREEDRLSIGLLSNLAVGTPDGRSVPLGTLAEIAVVGGPGTIQREDRRTTVTVSGEVASGSQRDAVMAEIQRAMAGFELPPGISWDLGRQWGEEQDQFVDMLLAGGLALVLIYIILAALFESLLLPVIIYFSIFFAVPGLALVFVLTGSTFSLLAFLGILITIGIVVNNSIVMIDLVNQLRERGMERREALLEGCTARLRPVLMTSVTTIIGLVPMAFMATEGMAAVFAPIGQAVIGGLTTSTFLTLLLTPTLYAWLDDIGIWLALVRRRALEVAGRGRGGAGNSADGELVIAREGAG